MATHRPILERFSDEVPEPQWERQSGVLAVYEAAPQPYWTTEPPTHPGVFWIRLPGYPGRVVEVYSQGGRLHYQWSDVGEQPVPRKTAALEWSDRAIVEPR